MKYLIVLLVFVSIIFSSCKKKLEKLNGNNVEFEVTEFELVETITLVIPNDQFNFQGVLNCQPLELFGIPFGPINFESFVPTQNPNPYAHLVYDIRPKTVTMELTNITDCDFGMLENVEVFLTDSSVTDPSQFILQDPNNISAPHNAVKIGELMTVEDGSNIINLVVNENAVLDQFIHNQSFNTYANMNLDKAFTEDAAIIKTSLLMSVKLINEN
jgi:hypothetical protein